MRILKEITVEVIQKCNLNCIFCSSISDSSKTNEIPIEKLKQISFFAKEKGAKEINISGGEPLLKKDLIEYISFNSRLNLNNNIYTSGNANINNFINELNKKKINSQKVKFIFNYQSHDQKIYNKLVACKSISIHKINENIKACIKSGYLVEAHIIPNALNLESIYSTSEYLKKIGVSKVNLLRLVFQGRASTNKSILKINNKKKLSEIIKRIYHELCDNHLNLRLGIPFNIFSKNKLICSAGYNKLIIKYDGTIFPCEAFKEMCNNNKFIIGNIYVNSLDKIWNNYSYLKKIKKLKKYSDFKLEPCPAQILYNNFNSLGT